MVLLVLFAAMACSGAHAPFKLTGTWEFRRGLHTGAGFQGDEELWRTIEFPFKLDDSAEFKNYRGWISFRMNIPAAVAQGFTSERLVGFFSGAVSDVAVFYVNETQIAAIGSADPYVPGHSRSALAVIPSDTFRKDGSDVFTAAIYSNGTYPIFIIDPHIRLDSLQGVTDFYTANTAAAVALCVLYAAVGFFHLLLFALRRKDRYNLFFGIFSVLAAVSWLTRTYWAGEVVFGAEVLLRARIRYAAAFIYTPAVLFFLSHLFDARYSRFGLIVAPVYLGVAAFIAAVPDYEGIQVARRIWLFTVFPIYAYILFYCLHATVRRKRDAGWILATMSFGVVAGFYDTLGARGYVPDLTLTNYVFLIVILGVAAILARRFMRAQNEMEELSGTLERKVEARTSELTNAQERLLDADRQKTAFFQNVSHELRTPLTMIIAPLERALETGMKLEDHTLEVIHANARRLLRLVNQLLDIQKLAAGKMTLEKRTFDLKEFLRVRFQMFESYAISQGLGMTFAVPDGLRPVHADPDAIEKCVYNYLSNAMKFTPPTGSVTLSARTAGAYVRVEVRDTGKGIPLEKQRMLFQRFGYSEPSVTREQEGTGLGLALVFELIQLHGGEVGVESDHGRGSAFYFTVPCALGRPEAFEPPEPTRVDFVQGDADTTNAQSNLPRQRRPNRHTVLVAEDNDDLREYLCGVLSDAGFAVLRAANGEEALRQLSRTNADLLITDLMMPKMSGLELLEKIRSKPEWVTMPAVLLTARADEETRQDVRDAGVDVCLSKPFSNRELVIVARNLVGLKSRERALLSEMSIARELQQRLLPAQLPEQPAFKMAARFLPVEAVGGDMYDYQNWRDGSVTLLVADASGHGVAAAMVAAMTKVAFHTVRNPSPQPDIFLKEMNSLLVNRIGNHFVTGILITVDASGHGIEFASAGHTPILLYRKGECRYFETTDFFLGMEAEVSFHRHRLDLIAGDRIFAYTDCALETRNPHGEFLGEDGLASIVGATANLDLDAQLGEVVQAIDAFRATPLASDDLTFVAMEVLH